MNHRTSRSRSRGRASAALGSAMLAVLLVACSSVSSADDEGLDASAETTLEVLPTTTTTTLPPVVAERVLILGDSSMVDAELAIGSAFAAAGADVVESDAAVGFGLTGMLAAGYPSPWREVWPELVDRVQPDLSIVMLGGWDMRWIDAYGVDAYRGVAAEAAQVLTARGGRVLWLSMLPDTTEKPDPEPPNAAFVGLPALFPGQVFYVDVAPALLGPSGDYPPSFLDADGRLLRNRKVDGWHLCQDGAVRIAELANRSAVELRLAAPAGDGWQRGAWWDDEAFTQSPACWLPGAWVDGGPDRTPPDPFPYGTPAPQG
jgi:hypothetical protein